MVLELVKTVGLEFEHTNSSLYILYTSRAKSLWVPLRASDGFASGIGCVLTESPDRPVGPSDGDFRMSNHQTLFMWCQYFSHSPSVYLADFCENAVHDFRSRWSMFLRAQPTRIQLSYESLSLPITCWQICRPQVGLVIRHVGLCDMPLVQTHLVRILFDDRRLMLQEVLVLGVP
jgi:hypothetical protein